ncbi:hypothetical protein Ddye_017568 [Dipteronia dyeriana]|uniref:Ubiquitin-like domain-containing protein n=1 Tax=Dipteronia dyeriana TaxID=168575 RepID=A0AAD9U9G6_9ROSI|nr:hypothetical protein Ddye_017568 [Dipteronia dyeriana]
MKAMEDHTNPQPLRLFVKLLNGKTAALNFTAPHVSGHDIKQRMYKFTRIPTHLQRLICSGYQLNDRTVISDDNATIHLVLSLLGGKGGFGSLLRGAATKAGQKKTNNFDACRDMSGRRLRHVNAEKKLEEWRAEEEGRKLEKIAEEFLKKEAKKGKKGVGDGQAEKYVAKYREVSAKCAAKVEESVREACGNGKRRTVAGTAADAKRLKIWRGKRKLGDGDGEDEDSSDDDDEETEKSVVVNNGHHSDSSKEAEVSSGSVTGGKQDAEFSGGGSCESGSEEEKVILPQQILEFGGEDVPNEENGVVEPEIGEEKVSPNTISCLEPAFVSVTEVDEAEKHECCGGFVSVIAEEEEVAGQSPNVLSSGNEEGSENKPVDAEDSGFPATKSVSHEETTDASTGYGEMERPLNFEEFDSAAEMEVLGMERLKTELQSRGLKCGGTLQERAARLFLLKTIPVEKLPKKLLAKK